MSILRARTVWERDRPASTVRPVAMKGRMDRLTPKQEENVRAALRVLRVRMGSLRSMSLAFGLNEKTVERVARGRTRATAGWALRIAEEAGRHGGRRAERSLPEAGEVFSVRAGLMVNRPDLCGVRLDD